MRKKIAELLAAVSLIFLAVVFATPLALAQDPDDENDEEMMEEVVVTGSRIKRSTADLMSPISSMDSGVFGECGYVTTAEAVNDFTANAPELNQAAGDGSSSGTGQQFPNLFGLGTGRTLTLVNSHRFVTSSVGLPVYRSGNHRHLWRMEYRSTGLDTVLLALNGVFKA